MGVFQLLRVAALAVVSTVPHGSAAVQDRADAARAVEYVDMTAPMIEHVAWALDLIDQADLPLPALRFEYHGDDRGPCGGTRGAHHRDLDRSIIAICTSETGEATEALILHELTHAWAAHHLSADRRASFRQLRGWTHWRDHDAAEWHENGSEQAAVIMTWALIDRPIGVVVIHDHACEDLEAGYIALTGDEPLHGFRDHCD